MSYIDIYADTKYIVENNVFPYIEGKHKYKVYNSEPKIVPIKRKRFVKVINGDTITVARKYRNSVALNMANSSQPGGGVEFGQYAQEESLFLRSDYYKSLPHSEYPIKEFGAIYTPNIQIIKNENYVLIRPFKMDFIASTMYDLRYKTYMSHEKYIENVKRKIKSVMFIAYETGHDCLVLGAWGCGAFKNDNRIIMECFKEVIEEYPIIDIVFAIKNGGNNYDVFSKLNQ